MLRPYVESNGIKHLTFVPSKRSGIVEDFSRRLANSLRIECVDLLEKKKAKPQKEMENSAHQCENAYISFSVKPDADIPGKVILVDDMVDSKWTLTVCGYRLMEKGCSLVLPFALADTSGGGKN